MAEIETKNALKVVDNFDLQTISKDFMQAAAEEMDGLGTLPFDQIKIPSGGGLAFEIPGEDEENPESVTEIKGILLAHYPMNAYWENKFAGGNDLPDCFSSDGVRGIERATGEIRDCATCLYNQFGSNGVGKACKNTQRLFFLREGNPVPLMISLPPTSIKYMRDYIKKIIFKRICSWQVITKITLKKEKNAAGITYSRVAFSFVGKLSDEKAKKAEAMRDCIKQQYRMVDADAEYSATGSSVSEKTTEPRIDKDGFMSIPEGKDSELPFQ